MIVCFKHVECLSCYFMHFISYQCFKMISTHLNDSIIGGKKLVCLMWLGQWHGWDIQFLNVSNCVYVFSLSVSIIRARQRGRNWTIFKLSLYKISWKLEVTIYNFHVKKCDTNTIDRYSSLLLVVKEQSMWIWMSQYNGNPQFRVK
jgi:hypothetical protein